MISLCNFVPWCLSGKKNATKELRHKGSLSQCIKISTTQRVNGCFRILRHFVRKLGDNLTFVC